MEGTNKAHENGEAMGFVGVRLTDQLGRRLWFILLQLRVRCRAEHNRDELVSEILQWAVPRDQFKAHSRLRFRALIVIGGARQINADTDCTRVADRVDGD